MADLSQQVADKEAFPSDDSSAETLSVKDPNLVEFDDERDPGNPRNWSVDRRVVITAAFGTMTFAVTFASSVFAVAISPVAEEYQIGEVTSTLGVSRFLIGFVLGPICFGPASEIRGRQMPLLLGYTAFAIFQIPVAVAQNVETIMLGRSLGGFAGSAPLAIVGGAMADLWDPVARANAICVFAAGAFAGPSVSPIIAGFAIENLSWRWTAWLTLILAGVGGLFGLLVIPETSASRILQLRARDLRYETGNWALHAKADEARITARTICTVYLVRPFVMMAQEPILSLITGMLSVYYGIIYLLFEAFPVAFKEVRGWSTGISGLPFAAFIVGIAMGTALMSYSSMTNFKRAYIKHGKAVPEERLPAMIISSIILPISIFWFAWTSDPNITWVPQIFSIAFMGMGNLVTFWQGINYIVDVYGVYSNSALAANTFVRSIFAAVFPLFAAHMYRGLGVAWASSILGILCVAFIPFPILFYIYGSRIRAKSRYAPT